MNDRDARRYLIGIVAGWIALCAVLWVAGVQPTPTTSVEPSTTSLNADNWGK